MKEFTEPMVEVVELVDDVIATSICSNDVCDDDCGVACQGKCMRVG